MAKNDSPRWIRTSCGYAGRNGFIAKYKKQFVAMPYPTDICETFAIWPLTKTFNLASEAKRWIDAGVFVICEVTPETSEEKSLVAGLENTD